MLFPVSAYEPAEDRPLNLAKPGLPHLDCQTHRLVSRLRQRDRDCHIVRVRHGTGELHVLRRRDCERAGLRDDHRSRVRVVVERDV